MEETTHDKTPGLNYPETYVLTQNRFSTFRFNFYWIKQKSDLKNAI